MEVNINASIAAVVNFDNIGFNESTPIIFTLLDEDAVWEGTHLLKVFNSAKKNISYDVAANLIQIAGPVMTIDLKPLEQELSTGILFYEIWNGTRVIFRGTLKINR
ncbi:MAG: hypothetical protein ITG00_00140 [Flavobacterium sp.]|nr:hypothetical protein [Flavobacterium sp.]